MSNWTRSDKLALVSILIAIFGLPLTCVSAMAAVVVVPEVRDLAPSLAQSGNVFTIAFQYVVNPILFLLGVWASGHLAVLTISTYLSPNTPNNPSLLGIVSGLNNFLTKYILGFGLFILAALPTHLISFHTIDIDVTKLLRYWLFSLSTVLICEVIIFLIAIASARRNP